MKEISSVNNELIKETAKLKEKKYRDMTNLFLIEGYHLIQMAKKYLQIVFVSNKEDYGKIDSVTYYYVTEEVINKLSQTKNSQGIIGVCQKMAFSSVSSNNIIALDNLQDPGNVGTIIRTALAFGIKDIVISDDTVDIYNDKVIRSSQGALFNVNIIVDNILKVCKSLKEQGYKIIGTSLNKAKELSPMTFSNKNIVIFGNEGNGVKEDILNSTDENIFIKINKEIDSLNVGVAASIIMYEISKLK